MSVTIDVRFLDEAEWAESKHPRDKGGQFASSPGGAPRASGSVFSKAGPLAKQLHAIASGAETPQSIAAKLKEAAGKFKSGYGASYANQLLAHLEGKHGLKKGSLGKAAPKAKEEAAPKVEATSEAPSKPTSSELPKPDPDNVGQLALYQLAEKAGTLAEKVAVVSKYAGVFNKKENIDYANSLLAALGAGEPAKELPSKPTSVELPEPQEGSLAQGSLYTLAQGPGTSIEKAAAVSKQLAHFSEKKNVDYGKALIEALGAGESAKEAKKEPPVLPPYHPSSDLQKKIYEVASGTGTLAEKSAAIAEIASKGASYAKEYAAKVKAALGVESGAPATPAKAPEPQQPEEVTSRRYARYHARFESAKSMEKGNAAEAFPTSSESVWKSVPQQVKKAVTAYTGAGYASINEALRSPETAHADNVERAEHIEAALASDAALVDHDVIVHRGLQIDADDAKRLHAAVKAGTPAMFMHEGFTSTSMSQATAMSFSKNAIMRILVPKGGRALNVMPVSNHESEREVVMNHGQTFEVVKAKVLANGKHHFTCVAK